MVILNEAYSANVMTREQLLITRRVGNNATVRRDEIRPKVPVL